ncbi:MAG: transposase [Verrucomicrobiota bacterium]
MPRIARTHQQTALCYHVFNRGINRQPIFRDEHDRDFLIKAVRKYKRMCGVRIFHWAWMETHYHLLIEVPFQRLRSFVGGFQQAYAQYHHARHGTSGVFWQGRYRSEPVEIGDYLACCGRYIERNPVRAGIASCAWEYPWSSARFYVAGEQDGVTDANTHLGFDEITPRDRKLYGDALMSTEIDTQMREMRQQRVLGSRGFVKGLEAKGGRHKAKRGRRW